MPVHGTRGTAGYERTIRLKRALVLRAPKASLLVLPPQARALVRTPQRKGVDPVLVPDDNDLVVPVNSRPILWRDWLNNFAAQNAECSAEPYGEPE